MHPTHRSRRCAGALAAALCVAALPASAHAGVLTGDAGTIDYRAAAGERNAVRLFVEQGEVTLTDAVAFSASGRCRLVAPRKARCGSLLRSGIVRLGDRDDSALVQVSTSGTLTVLGGEGDDLFNAGAVRGGPSRVQWAGDQGTDTIDYVSADRGVRLSVDHRANDGRPGDADGITNVERLRGSLHGDTIDGGPAGELIDGRAGGDVLRGNGGDDTIVEGRFLGLGGTTANGGDFISGGSGQDSVLYRDRTRAVTVTFEGRFDVQNDGEAGEGDNVMNDVELVEGGRANDTLHTTPAAIGLAAGNEGDDRLTGTPGRDVLIGGAGRDLLFGLEGDDLLIAEDGERDVVQCGAGEDQASLDVRLDTRFACESHPGVGTFRLAPRSVTARAGARTTLRFAWTHPARWSELDEVTLLLERKGRRVGTIRFDQETGRVRGGGRGIALLAHRSGMQAGGPAARRVTLRLALRISPRHTGETLVVRAGATADGGTRQRPSRAGAIRVARG